MADEINRASPKTQSALLECMEERQVTVDGVSYELARPFLVMATQNPLEMEGTYPLPEAQRDRFTARVSMGYPDRDAELAMLDERADHRPADHAQPRSPTPPRCATWSRPSAGCTCPRRCAATSSPLVEASRRSPDLRLGASPRAGLQLLRAARAAAALAGRDHVLPDDVQALAGPVLAHRLLLTAGRDPRPAQRRAGGRRPAVHRARSPAGADRPWPDRCAGRWSALTLRGRCLVAGGPDARCSSAHCWASGHSSSSPSSSSPCRCSRR